MKTTLKAGYTTKGNLVATTEDGSTRFLLSASGEFKTGPDLQFPDYILDTRIIDESGREPEMMMRVYDAEIKAAKLRAELLASHTFGGAFVTAERWYKSALEDTRNLRAEFAAFKASPALLKKALAKAETLAAKKKERDAFSKKVVKAFSKLKAPKSPLKGAGYSREDFATGNDWKKKIILAKLPNSHKDEISSRRQKGHFSWSVVISPEAAAIIKKLIA